MYAYYFSKIYHYSKFFEAVEISKPGHVFSFDTCFVFFEKVNTLEFFAVMYVVLLVFLRNKNKMCILCPMNWVNWVLNNMILKNRLNVRNWVLMKYGVMYVMMYEVMYAVMFEVMMNR